MLYTKLLRRGMFIPIEMTSKENIPEYFPHVFLYVPSYFTPNPSALMKSKTLPWINVHGSHFQLSVQPYRICRSMN